MKKWISILSQEKIKKISNILSENLFILHPEYRKILIKHANVCYDIEQFGLIDVTNEACDMITFQERQEKKKNYLIHNLKSCSENMHESSNEGLKKIVEDLKNVILGEGSYEDVA